VDDGIFRYPFLSPVIVVVDATDPDRDYMFDGELEDGLGDIVSGFESSLLTDLLRTDIRDQIKEVIFQIIHSRHRHGYVVVTTIRTIGPLTDGQIGSAKSCVGLMFKMMAGQGKVHPTIKTPDTEYAISFYDNTDWSVEFL